METTRHREGDTMATIKDVAAYCGVAVSTVSRVLNGHPDVSQATSDKVMAAVRELHYVPNHSARDLAATRPVKSIGLVVRGAENPFYIPIIAAIGDACEAAGYTMVLRQIPSGADEAGEGAELVQSKRLMGLILLGGRFDYSQEEGKAFGVPVVCCTFVNQFGDLDQESYSSVSIDDANEAYRATHELVANGHRHIAVLLDAPDDRSISELRYRGYRQALEDAGLPVQDDLVVRAANYTMSAAYEGVRDLLARRPDVTAIFSVSDLMAVAAMKAIHDLGYDVPGDISVIAIDGLESTRYSIPVLTTFEQPQKELGEESVRILIDTIENGAESKRVFVGTKLRRGGTLAPCRTAGEAA